MLTDKYAKLTDTQIEERIRRKVMAISSREFFTPAYSSRMEYAWAVAERILRDYRWARFQLIGGDDHEEPSWNATEQDALSAFSLFHLGHGTWSAQFFGNPDPENEKSRVERYTYVSDSPAMAICLAAMRLKDRKSDKFGEHLLRLVGPVVLGFGEDGTGTVTLLPGQWEDKVNKAWGSGE